MELSNSERLKVLATLFGVVDEVWNRRFPRGGDPEPGNAAAAAAPTADAATAASPASPPPTAGAAAPGSRKEQFYQQAENMSREELKRLRVDLGQRFLRELNVRMAAASR